MLMKKKENPRVIAIKAREYRNNSLVAEVNLHRKQLQSEAQALVKKHLNISKTIIQTEMSVKSTNFKS